MDTIHSNVQHDNLTNITCMKGTELCTIQRYADLEVFEQIGLDVQLLLQ